MLNYTLNLNQEKRDSPENSDQGSQPKMKENHNQSSVIKSTQSEKTTNLTTNSKEEKDGKLSKPF